MAKRFLETLGDAFEDNVLEDVIPVAGSEKRPTPKRKRGRSGRKKAILEALDEAFEVQRSKQQRKPKKGRKKSFLQQLNDDLGSPDLGELIPSKKNHELSEAEHTRRPALSRFPTSLHSDLLENIRSDVRPHSLRLREVLQEATTNHLSSQFTQAWCSPFFALQGNFYLRAKNGHTQLLVFTISNNTPEGVITSHTLLMIIGYSGRINNGI